MSKKLTREQFTNRWVDGLKQSVTKYKEGVAAVTENPAAKAIEKQDKWMQAVVDSKPRYVAGLRKVTLDTWKNNSINIGSARLANGAEKGKPKVHDFSDYVVNTTYALADEVNSMPDLTLEDRINKATTLMRKMHDNPYKR